VPKDIFISYAHDDRKWAELVCAQLEEAGVTCWIAPRDIAPGVTWPAAIADAIDHCRVMIIVFSSHANQSPQMARELGCADARRVPILPVRVENVTPAGDMEYFLGNRQWFDLHERTIERRITGLPEAISGLLAGADVRVPFAPAPAKRKNSGMQRWLLGTGVAVAAMGAILYSRWPPKSAPAQPPVVTTAAAPASTPAEANPKPAQVPAANKDARPAQVRIVPRTEPVTAARLTEPPPVKAPENPSSFAGQWQALVKYSWGDSHKEVFNFKVDQNELFGTASYVGGPRGILDGKIEGNKITFTTKSITALGDKTYEEKHNYRGRLAGDAIEFMLQTDSGYDSRTPEEFTAKRVEPAKPEPGR
jgi:TIR domain